MHTTLRQLVLATTILVAIAAGFIAGHQKGAAEREFAEKYARDRIVKLDNNLNKTRDLRVQAEAELMKTQRRLEEELAAANKRYQDLVGKPAGK